MGLGDHVDGDLAAAVVERRERGLHDGDRRVAVPRGRADDETAARGIRPGLQLEVVGPLEADPEVGGYGPSPRAIGTGDPASGVSADFPDQVGYGLGAELSEPRGAEP